MGGLSDRAQAYLDRLGQHVIKPGLETTRLILRAFDNPHSAQPSILIAGTNGKGSCSAMLHSVLLAAGAATAGLYTSPHLVDVTERIRVETEPVATEELSRLLEGIERVSIELLARREIDREPTYFEALTVAAFLHFRHRRCEVAVLEVGMGGKFDATNVVDPILSIITPISFDHEEYLGRTLRRIAGEKAGIMRPGVPAVSAKQPEEAAAALSRCAQETATPLCFDEASAIERRDLADGRFEIRRGRDDPWIGIPLPGEHQVSNASLVLAACDRLEAFRKIDQTARRHGIETCVWPGRLERVAARPDIYVDGCHNPAGAATVRDFIARRGNAPKVLVFGCMKDKRIREMVEILFPAFDAVVVTSAGGDRAADPRQIRETGRGLAREIYTEGDVRRIMGAGAKWIFDPMPLPPESICIVAGSLYLVGAVKRVMAGG